MKLENIEELKYLRDCLNQSITRIRVTKFNPAAFSRVTAEVAFLEEFQQRVSLEIQNWLEKENPESKK